MKKSTIGIYVDGSDIQISNSLITDNSGGIYAGVWVVGSANNFRLENSTISHNSGDAGIEIRAGSSSAIFYGNQIHNTP